MDLTVHVRIGDMIEVDQRQASDPAAGERLGRPGPDTPDANHHRMRGRDTCGARIAVGTYHATEAARRDVVTGRRTGRGISRGDRFRRQGSSTVEPVVLRPSRSRCACAASASG